MAGKPGYCETARETAANNLQLQTRKHESTKTRKHEKGDALIQDHPPDSQGGSIEVEEKAHPETCRSEI
jgi:hypothetical protein